MTLRAVIAGTVVALGTLLAAVAPATAASGTTTIALDGPAARSLADAGVRLSARGAARLLRGRLALPLGAASADAAGHTGGLTLRRARRSVRLTNLTLTLGPRAEITARAGRARVSVLTVHGAQPALDVVSGALRLSGADLRLTSAGGRLLRRALRLRRAPRGVLGAIRTSGTLSAAEVATTGTNPAGGSTPGGPPGPGGSVPAGGNPNPPPIGDEPPLLARPAGAADVVSTEIVWHPRESFIRYINSGEGTSTSDGATSGAPTVRPGTDAALVYDFGFPFVQGWAVPGSDTAALYHRGTVNFSYRERGIDLDAKDPEVELNGAASRAIFRFDGRGSTRPGNKRAVLVDLQLDRARARTVSPDGKTISWEQIPGTIPAGAAQSSVFAGFYQPGDEFGWISIRYTLP